ncbi:flagellar assembly protein FliX [Pelagibacterium halotolerans]|uniref:Flagellar trans-acting factor FliX n=1 Tax=Pelagibacterium halotolerans (strain DSM 22347 / JCM 15775 / CGMCC 1.7692 / B2) TaxID=1082931 RepID=G4REB7_PELHB|nr:flagellar assembly protein FliX [Pelagibacterium halotolerans]AEQ51881.1 flagellar trans-acting factor FliX [Pelagibacterium halotolerans B2]QJR18315.1 flagellar assembly regulator FliX [Pelagibacterium halotolerans]SEA25923.1 Class II flagellar assembly regulator [Pelagibacterium halotolerans]
MRIDGTGRVIPANRSGTAAKSSGPTFQIESGQGSARTAQTSAPIAAGGIDALLALQAADDATTGRRKALKRANSLLDVLEEIKADLLVGRMGEGRLNRAAALLAQAKTQIEPELEAIVADIELRVRVELAKLGRYPGA